MFQACFHLLVKSGAPKRRRQQRQQQSKLKLINSNCLEIDFCLFSVQQFDTFFSTLIFLLLFNNNFRICYLNKKENKNKTNYQIKEKKVITNTRKVAHSRSEWWPSKKTY